MAYSIREASFEDLPDIARIHVQSWQQTYVGMVPQDYLDGMSIPARQKTWEAIFQGTEAENRNLYIAHDDGEAVGFISFGPSRDDRKRGWGEIYAVYLLKKSWGKSIGYQLFETAERKFRDAGITSVHLWALDANKNALSAYNKWGGIVDPDLIQEDEIGGQKVREIMVIFSF